MIKDSNQTEQEHLLEVLKFTPQKVQLSLVGWGAEVWAGKVERQVYDFFRDNRYSLEEYAWRWSDKWEDRVPEHLRPFDPGCPYDCDDIFHSSGANLSSESMIQVHDAQGDEIWSQCLDHESLTDAKVRVEQSFGDDIIGMIGGDKDQVVMIGQNGEKGCFFEAEFVLTAPFDPSCLTIYFEQCEDWYIVSGVDYNGESLEGSDGYDTRGKSSEIQWMLLNGETVYEPLCIDDEESD